MALLTELFLILAGFESGISQTDVHPAEFNTLEQARHFGDKVHELRKLTDLPHPVCKLLKREVVIAYLHSLAQLEDEITMLYVQDSRISLTNSLVFTGTIIARSVDAWESKFDFALDFLSRIDSEFELIYNSLVEFVNKNVGFSDLKELGLSCLRELDKAWLADLRRCILGETKVLDNHPNLERAEIIADTRDFIVQLNEMALQDIQALDAISDLTGQIAEVLAPESLPLPLTSIEPVLLTVEEQVSHTMGKLFPAAEVSVVLKVLRDTALCGSSVFVQVLGDSSLDAAIDAYNLYTDDAATSRCIASGLISARGRYLHIELSQLLRLVVSQAQCATLESIFEWLLMIVVAQQRIKIGSGTKSFQDNLFFNELWAEYQGLVDEALLCMRSNMLSEGKHNMRRENDAVLQNLVEALHLDSAEFKDLLTEVCENDAHSSEDLVRLRALMTE